MNFVFNTRSKDAGVDAVIYALSKRIRDIGYRADVNCWNNYKDYDVVVFMAYDHDIDQAKAKNPSIRVILADPKLDSDQQVAAVREADGIIVSSVEQRENFLNFNSACFVYHMFQDYKMITRKNTTKQNALRIVYHGNQRHIKDMLPTVWPALQSLSKFCEVKLGLIYNISALGRIKFSRGYFKDLHVKHIQWHPKTLISDLSKYDVGLLPNQIYGFDCEQKENLLYHTVKFKSSANPGRIYPYACASLPVIGDFTPSVCQYIEDGVSGYLAASSESYFSALMTLYQNPGLREKMANNLRDRVERVSARQHINFVSFVVEIVSNKPSINFSVNSAHSPMVVKLPKQLMFRKIYRRFLSLIS